MAGGGKAFQGSRQLDQVFRTDVCRREHREEQLLAEVRDCGQLQEQTDQRGSP